MTFSSLTFLFIFLPVTFLLYVIIPGNVLKNVLLVLASLVFYAFGEPVAVFIMIISIICNYFLGLLCSKEKHDKLAVVIAVILNIGLLFVFKYLGFLTKLINDVSGLSLPVPNIALPIGISFFTFQGLSYVIDIYRDKESVQKNLLSVFLYISFFPQLIAGPIVKYHDIESQLKTRELSIDRVSKGVNRFIIGLSKKLLISNQMGYIADMVYAADISGLSTFSAWMGTFCYALQVFFDFSGYSDMAIGLGCIFGFDFKENFDYPFISTSIQEFWRRWHISLSTWFKEYVYIPLGGNRKGNLITYRNRMLVFFLTGLWHGANLTFIVWGLLHGILILLEGSGIIPLTKKWFKPFSRIYLIFTLLITFVPFRAESITDSVHMLGRMFAFSAGNPVVNNTIMAGFSVLFVITLILGIIFATPIIPYIKKKLYAINKGEIYEHANYIVTLLLFAICILFLVSSKYNPFIYFRF